MNYEELGFKCGIEIHQQIEGKKLFCSCKAEVKDDETQTDVEVVRTLRAVVGETGVIDAAALHESKKHIHYVYRGDRETSCLVELDEEPPHPMNKDALQVVLQVSHMMEADIVDEVQVMRKNVVDGSNTTGFQRTSLVAQDGKIETSHGDIRIDSICIEEDSCTPIKRHKDHVLYNLSRLGTPLIELATAPDIKNPEHCREASEKIGMILRSTGKVKRGLGTIRQDVNVSIREGDRVEIKGAQDLKLIPILIDNEIKRQLALVQLKNELTEKLGDFDVTQDPKDITQVMERSESKVISTALQKKGVVKAIKLPGFAGFLGRETQPGKRLGTEFSDYGKVRGGVGGLFHSDELPKYGITEGDVKHIREALECRDEDAFIMVADKESRVDLALEGVMERANLVKFGVIREVRKANPDASTTYMRPMPGAARMYPETDVLPINPGTIEVKEVELIDDKIVRFQNDYKLAADLATVIAKSVHANDFEESVKACPNVKPAFVGEAFISVPREIRRKHDKELDIATDTVKQVLAYINDGIISSSELIPATIDIEKGEFDPKKYEKVSDDELESQIKVILEDMAGKPPGAIMGQVMKHFGGKVDGKKAMQLIQKLSK